MEKALNKKIWLNKKEIDPEVRKNLLQIANDFINSLKVNKLKLVDVRLTGSLANYNYHDKSDLDLHLIFDLSNFDKHKEFIKELLRAKKVVWNLKHNITLHGFPVEVYGEDISDEHVSTGVFSLAKNEWLKEPSPEEVSADDIDKKQVMRKYRDKVDTILHMEELAEKSDDYTKIIKDMENFVVRLKDSRQKALEKDGEMSIENIVFKMLRKNGFIERLVDLKNKLYDENLTIEQLESEFK